MSLTIDLQPCPFCNSADLQVYEPEGVRVTEMDGYETEAGFVACNACGASGPPGLSVEAVTQRWNERAMAKSAS